MSSHEWILRASSTAKLRTAICAAALSAAFVLGAGASTSLADDRGGRSSNGAHAIALPADLRPVLDLYRDGGSGLGVPALIVRGTTPERTIAVDDVDGDG